ncbi:MAG: hypothetical protein R3Y28_00660 [Candidatus Gastranaerophilales bacterium]
MSVSTANASNDTTITMLSLNDELFFDIEIMLINNDKILLPTKQIADILETQLKINHSTKELEFDDVKITKTDIYKNGQKVSNKVKNIYLKQGLMDDVRDEIFCDEEVLSNVFGSMITTNQEDLSVSIITEKPLEKLFVNSSEEIDTKVDENDYKAYSDVEKPVEKGLFSLDTVTIDNSGYSDSAAQIYQTTTSSTSSFVNTNRVMLKGGAFDGLWNADLSSNTNKDEFFSFSGVSVLFQKEYDGNNYELGKIKGFVDADYQIGSGVLGVQVYDHNPKKENYRQIEGEVDKESVINVYVNDEFYKTVSTYNGYYSLEKLQIKIKKLYKLEIKELTQSGEEKSLLVKNFAKNTEDGFNLSSRERKRTAFVGMSGYNNRLFAQDGYLYEVNSKKFTAGVREQYGIKENFTSDTKLLFDKIISYDDDTIWALNYYNNSSILSMGTYQNPNLLEGATALNTLNYKFSDNLRLKTIIAQSSSKNIADGEINVGYSATVSTIYEKNNLRLETGVYNQSTDFYLAGSQYGFVSDRLGAKIGVNYRIKDWSMNARYNKYFSNLEKQYDTSITGFDEVNFGLSGKIKHLGTLQYSFNGKKGSNNVGENLNYYQNLNLQKCFKNGISIDGGLRKSYYSSEYVDTENNTNFLSEYSTIYLKTGLPMPKRKGKLELGHEIFSSNSSGYETNYNLVKFDYTFPEIKRILLKLGLGYKYTGVNKGFNYNATVGYRTKSGMIVSLGYRFDTNNGYLIDNMYIPTSTRHSINFTVNDTFAMMPNGLKSVGQNDETKGFVEVVAYLDKNGNNIFDEGDVGVEDVPINLSWKSDVEYTNKGGKIPVATANKGVYNISVDNDTLQSNLSVAKNTKDRQLVLVQSKKHTKVDFKLTSSVGNIKGNIKIIDDFGRNKSIKDFIIVLHDEKDKEVAYSTVDKSGDYYFSGIAPGKYQIMLDESFVKSNNLVAYENKGKLDVDIPFVYKDFVDIYDKNLMYKAW